MLRGVLSTVLVVPAATAAFLVAVPVAALGLPFWLVSGFTHLATRAARRMRPQPIPWHDLVEFDPVVGWKPKAGLDAHAMSDRVFHLTTDEEGWRGRTRLEEAKVVVIGDSFAFGTGVDDPDFFADQPVGVPIKAVGGNGYSMVHELLWLERLRGRLEGKLVVWFVYYGNDLLDNLRPSLGSHRMPFVRERRDNGGWEIVTHHVAPEAWPIPDDPSYYDELAELCCPGHVSCRAYAACESLIIRGRAVCEEAGAELVVMGIPDPKQLDPVEAAWLAARARRPEAFDPARPDKELAAICDRLSVRFVTLRDHLTRSDYKDHDCHWNPRGHRRVAELLARLHGEREDASIRKSIPIARPRSAITRIGGGI